MARSALSRRQFSVNSGQRITSLCCLTLEDEPKLFGFAGCPGRYFDGEDGHALVVLANGCGGSGGGHGEHSGMGTASGFCAGSNEAPERYVDGRRGIGVSGDGEEEVRVRGDAHVIGVLREVLVTECVKAGRDGLAAIVGGAFGEVGDGDELSVGQRGVKSAWRVLVRCREGTREPEISSRAVVEGDAVALVFDGLLQVVGGRERGKRPDALDGGADGEKLR